MNMKRITIIFFSLLAICTACRAQKMPNVLFIGNSYTSVNNLPVLLDSVAKSAGYAYTYDRNTPGGCTFSMHCTNTSMTKICQGGWNFVVLQEQSQLPSFPQNQVETECLPYAKQLADSIKAHGGMPMFYMTWGRKNGDQENAQIFPVLGTYEGMDSMLYERYMQMAIDNKSAVCPVGRVWRYIRTNYPGIELYDPDGSHPSMAGSYAAACSFFVMIFNVDPDSIKYDAGLKDTEAADIRAAVKSVVYGDYDKWIDPASYEDPEEPTGVEFATEEVVGVWPNPVSDMLRCEGEFEIVDMSGRVVMRGCDEASVTGLASGCYMLVQMGGDGVKRSVRFIKR